MILCYSVTKVPLVGNALDVTTSVYYFTVLAVCMRSVCDMLDSRSSQYPFPDPVLIGSLLHVF